MSYYDIYQMRLNRFGYNYQERVQTEREKMFDLYLAKSIYKVEFEYNSTINPLKFNANNDIFTYIVNVNAKVSKKL